MGTDIHMIIETLNWHPPRTPAEEAVYRLSGGEELPKCWKAVAYEGATYHARNYRVFAQLCGVRASGFNLKQIAEEPRDLPNDCCEETERLLRDYHSQSWVTLEEVLAHDWGDNTGFRDWVKCTAEVAGWEYFGKGTVRFVFGFDS